MVKPTGLWFPFYVGDYTADTIGLTLAQHGAYVLALAAYWRRGGPLPDAEARAIMQVEADMVLTRFFTPENGRWRQKRADIEIARAAQMQANLSERGRLGNAIRWNKDTTAIAERSNGDPTAILGDPPSPSPSPSPSESSSKKEAARMRAEIDQAFEEFYAAYPLHKGRGQALKAFRTAIKKTTLAELAAGARRYADDPSRDPKFTKHPATWLNGECWKDEAITVAEPDLMEIQARIDAEMRRH